MSMIKVLVNDKCIGCGACVALVSEVFELNEEGFSQAKKEVIKDRKIIEKVREAMESCPVSAIQIIEV